VKKIDLTRSLTVSLALRTLAIPARWPNERRAGETEGPTAVWTNLAGFYERVAGQ
jgi:hypothetical protein